MPSKDKTSDKTSKKTSSNPAQSAQGVQKTAGKKQRKTTSSEPTVEIKHRFDRLPRAPFLRQVKEMAKDIDPDARVQAQLLDRLEQVQQEFLYNLVSNTVRAAKNFNRKTMMVKDLDFVMDIQQSSGSKMNMGAPSVAAPATAASSN